MGHFAASLGMFRTMLLAVLCRSGFDCWCHRASQCGYAEGRVIGRVRR